MSAGEVTAADIRVVSGCPTDEELAAVAVVTLAAMRSGTQTAHEPLAQSRDTAWRRSARTFRRPLEFGADAWRASLR